MDKKLIDPLIKTRSSFENTQDSFRKSSKGFNSTTQLKDFGSNIQIIKTDILEVQSLIKKYSDVLMFYKSSKQSYPTFIQKKLTEFEDKQETSKVLDSIKSDSENVDKQLKIYNCQDKSELIPKLYLELNYNEMLIKKLNDLAFLITTRINPDLNNNTIFQDSKSKVWILENLLELMLSKINKEQTSEPKVETKKIKKGTISENDSNLILKMENIDDFFNLNTSDNVLSHIQKLFKKSYSHITSEFENLTAKFSIEDEKFKKETSSYHENLLKLEKYLRLNISKKDKKIEDLNKKIVNAEDYIKNLGLLEKVDIKNESEKVQFLFTMIDECIITINIIFIMFIIFILFITYNYR